MYSHSLSGQRYSPLTDITAANVARLAPAWSLRLTQPQPPAGRGAPPAAPAVEGAPATGTPAPAPGRGRRRRTPRRRAPRSNPQVDPDRD